MRESRYHVPPSCSSPPEVRDAEFERKSTGDRVSDGEPGSVRERVAVGDPGDRVSTGDPFDDCRVDETIVSPGGKRVSELASVRLEVGDAEVSCPLS